MSKGSPSGCSSRKQRPTISLKTAASVAVASVSLAEGGGISGKAAMRRRLSRDFTMKSLVSDSAVQARVALRQFGSYPRPRYTRWRAILYGSFIDWAICLRLPLGDNVIGFIAKRGGPEQVRLLLTLASFDEDCDGSISDEELLGFYKLSDEIISDGNAMCGNLAVVAALLVGLSHNVTVGRPVPLAYAPGVEEQYGDGLLWLVYAFNLCAEAGAFFTMCMAIIARNCLTNILPTRHHKVDFLRTTNALGNLGIGMQISLWFFLLTAITHTLCTSPRLGILGCGIMLLLLAACMNFIAPVRYLAVMLLHEEVVLFLKNQQKKSDSVATGCPMSGPSPATPHGSFGSQRISPPRSRSSTQTNTGELPVCAAGSPLSNPHPVANLVAGIGELSASSVCGLPPV